MPRVVLALTALLGSGALLLAGNGLQTTAVALQIGAAGYRTEWVGAMMAGYFAGFVAGSHRAGDAIRQVGHIRAFTTFGGLLGAAAMAHALTPANPVWLALRALAGFSMAGLFMVTESWLHAASPAQGRGTVLALYMVAVFGGLGSGQMLLGAFEPMSLEPFCAAALLVSLGVVPISLTRTHAPPLPELPRMPLRVLARAAPLGLVAAVAGGAVNATLYGLGPVFAQTTGRATPGVASFMAVTVLSGLALQVPIGRLSDRIDRRAMLVGVPSVFAGVALGALLLRDLPAAGLLAIGGGLGSLGFAFYPLGLAHAFDRLEPEAALPATAALLLASGVGAVAGPIASGGVMAAAGPEGFLAALLAIGVALAIYGLWRILHVEAVPLEEQDSYVALPRMTAHVAELDPRVEAPPEAPEESPTFVATEPDGTSPAPGPERTGLGAGGAIRDRSGRHTPRPHGGRADEP